jgi:hypothetical protein
MAVPTTSLTFQDQKYSILTLTHSTKEGERERGEYWIGTFFVLKFQERENDYWVFFAAFFAGVFLEEEEKAE